MKYIFSGQEASSRLNNGVAIFKQANAKPNKKCAAQETTILFFNLIQLHYFKVI